MVIDCFESIQLAAALKNRRWLDIQDVCKKLSLRGFFPLACPVGSSSSLIIRSAYILIRSFVSWVERRGEVRLAHAPCRGLEPGFQVNMSERVSMQFDLTDSLIGIFLSDFKGS